MNISVEVQSSSGNFVRKLVSHGNFIVENSERRQSLLPFDSTQYFFTQPLH